MKYKLNEVNNITGFIKELLKEFNLPVYKIFTSETIPYVGETYVKDNEVVVYRGLDSKGNMMWRKLDNYVRNYKKYNLTKNLLINTSDYDLATHYYLGNYLRFVRDYDRLNLMPLYNCFAGEYAKNLSIHYGESYKYGKNEFMFITNNDYSPNRKKVNYTKDWYKFYVVPVKFNQVYTIALDSYKPVEICCCIYDGNNITIYEDGDITKSDITKNLITATYTKYNNTTFRKPFLFDDLLDGKNELNVKDFIKYEKNLYMIIKVDSNVDSSIAVLEGDYTYMDSIVFDKFTSNAKFVPNFVYETTNTEKCPGDKDDIDYIINTHPKLSLLINNNKHSYAFSERLVEYLLGHAITFNNEIPEDIGYVQLTLLDSFKNVIYNIWDDRLNKNLHNKLFTISPSKQKTSGEIKGNCFDTETAKNKDVVLFGDHYTDMLTYIDKDAQIIIDRLYNLKTRGTE